MLYELCSWGYELESTHCLLLKRLHLIFTGCRGSITLVTTIWWERWDRAENIRVYHRMIFFPLVATCYQVYEKPESQICVQHYPNRTQTLTEMRTMNASWGWRRLVLRADNLTTFMCWLSWNLGISTSWNPQGLSRPVMGLLYLYLSWTVATIAFFDIISSSFKDNHPIIPRCANGDIVSSLTL